MNGAVKLPVMTLAESPGQVAQLCFFDHQGLRAKALCHRWKKDSVSQNPAHPRRKKETGQTSQADRANGPGTIAAFLL